MRFYVQRYKTNETRSVGLMFSLLRDNYGRVHGIAAYCNFGVAWVGMDFQIQRQEPKGVK